MCWKCGKTSIIPSPIPRSAECPFCGSDLHSCRNCNFYSPGSHYDCHESVDENVKDKERSNFCQYFSFNGSLANSVSTNLQQKKDDARKAFESLFN